MDIHRWLKSAVTVFGALLLTAFLSTSVQAVAMLTKAGTKYRIITKKECQLLKSPDPGAQSSPCSVFQYWYVLPPNPGDAPTFTDDPEMLKIRGHFRVASGDSEKEFRGYIKVEDAELWTHQQVVRMTPQDTRSPAFFYETKEDALGAVQSGDTARATHTEPASSGKLLILMPVMDVKEEEADGQKVQIFKTAFMSASEAAIGSQGGQSGDISSSNESANEIRRSSTVDIVFVVDTTASMEPPIGQVLRSIAATSEKLKTDPDLAKRVRYGLVAYRDTVGSPNRLDYVAKVFCTLEEGKDHQAFLDRLGNLQVANTGSGDYPEDVLAGIDMALDFDQIKWNPTAWKQIIVVGDSSIKCEDHPQDRSRANKGNLTIPQIMAMAQSGGDSAEALKEVVAINSVLIQDPSMSGDNDVAIRQFNELVSGRAYSGVMLQAKGGSDPEDFSAGLADELLARYQNFKATVVGGQAPPSGSGGGGSTASSAKMPLPILRLIAKAQPGDPPMSFSSKHVAEFDKDWNRLLIPQLWVRKGDIKSFNAFLNFLVQQLDNAGQPGSKNVPQILNSLKQISTVINIQEPITADMPLDKFFKLLGGFPLKSEIFHVTVNKLATMTQTDYDDWVKGIKACTETLQVLADNPQYWRKLHPQAEEREEYAFIQMNDLP